MKFLYEIQDGKYIKEYQLNDEDDLIPNTYLSLTQIDCAHYAPDENGDPVYIEGSDPLPYELTLEQLREIKIIEINNACQIDIIAGSWSNALGENHRYDSDIVDQLNFMQAMSLAQIGYMQFVQGHASWVAARDAAAATVPPTEFTIPEPVEPTVPYRIWNTDNLTKGWFYHTYAQFCQVLYDGANNKAMLLMKCSTLKEAATAATSKEALELIVW